MDIQKVFIIGSEQTKDIASAITQKVACGGCSVTVKCDEEPACAKASEEIKQCLDEKVANGELSAEQADAALNRIQTTSELSDAKNADIVIESGYEDEAAKRKTLSHLDDICSPETILATNTSTITVTSLASTTNRPDQVIGAHFIYFSPVMKVVEIARGIHTSDATFNAVENLAKLMDMEVVVSEDTPGLLSTRIWMVHLNEAANNVFHKLVEPEGLKKLNRTISPNALSILESADFVGLDNCVALLRNLYGAYGDPKYIPSPLLIQMVEAGHLGIRSGKGFFNYK